MSTYRQGRLALLLLSIVLALFALSPAAAQCAVPSGWQPYTVTRGDNLYRLSIRFRTTIALLRSGNCLAGTRINAGQTLYVPGGSPAPIPNPSDRTISTTATFQWFERGFMVWRSDTGDIWVYEEIREAVKSRNRLTVHGVNQYGGLAAATNRPPTGLLQPIMGFGKVWANLNSYKDSLGWAVQSESAYTLQIRLLDGGIISFTLPDGSRIERHSDGFWSNVPGRNTVVPALSPPPTEAAVGPVVRVLSPSSGARLATGSSFSLAGEAAGIFEASFVLELQAVPSGSILASQVVTYLAPDVELTGTWQATLTPSFYTGAAEIRAIYIRPSDGGRVILAAVPVTFD